ncbi:hypothetical protein DFH27DRAFT_604292 [Peziza echinospora]|nr:hypothetical protein DFH27DRAFT_604292 [Peziza echinospora]
MDTILLTFHITITAVDNPMYSARFGPQGVVHASERREGTWSWKSGGSKKEGRSLTISSIENQDGQNPAGSFMYKFMILFNRERNWLEVERGDHNDENCFTEYATLDILDPCSLSDIPCLPGEKTSPIAKWCFRVSNGNGTIKIGTGSNINSHTRPKQPHLILINGNGGWYHVCELDTEYNELFTKLCLSWIAIVHQDLSDVPRFLNADLYIEALKHTHTHTHTMGHVCDPSTLLNPSPQPQSSSGPVPGTMSRLEAY